MIKINRDKCTKCMTCLRVCPFTALQEIDGRPQLALGKMCISCMHCGAACPEEAITYGDRPCALEGEAPKIREDFAKELKNHILTRRSYRHFTKEPVQRQVIEEALDMASWAPSAKNQHTTKWIIIDSKEVMEKIMECILNYVDKTGVSPEIASEYAGGNNVVMGTSTALLLAYAKDNSISPETDTAIAMATAELYLQARGIGTCWAGYLKRMANTLPEIQALLPQLPENNSFYGAFMIGYPDGEKYLRIPERIKRADISWV